MRFSLSLSRRQVRFLCATPYFVRMPMFTPMSTPKRRFRNVKNEHKQVAKEIEAVTSTIAGAADVQLPRLDAKRK